MNKDMLIKTVGALDMNNLSIEKRELVKVICEIDDTTVIKLVKSFLDGVMYKA